MENGNTYEFDLVTIGAGSGGTRASRFSAQHYGAKVAVVELPFGLVANDDTGGAGGTYACALCCASYHFPAVRANTRKPSNTALYSQVRHQRLCSEEAIRVWVRSAAYCTPF